MENKSGAVTEKIQQLKIQLANFKNLNYHLRMQRIWFPPTLHFMLVRRATAEFFCGCSVSYELNFQLSNVLQKFMNALSAGR